MKSTVRTLAIAAAMFCAAGAFAQTAAPAAKASAPAVTAPAAKAAATPSAPAAKAAKTVAPGGGNGKVWVNTASKVYHCEGSKDYGTTKVGEYMTEADAKAKGFHGVKGKACAK